MTLTKDNVLFIYRNGDADSLALAEQYQDIHNLDNAQLVAINCSNVEVLKNYATFKSEVENPIIVAVSTSAFPIRAVVLGYKVPGGFLNGIDTISSTSRISRAAADTFHNFKGSRVSNILFDRKDFKEINSTDTDFAIVCTRIDGPTFAIVEDWFKQIKIAKNTRTVSGNFFFDPFSAFDPNKAQSYTDEMIDFSNSLLKDLGLNVVSTEFVDPYIDPFIRHLESDSFFWGWGSDDGSLTYFKRTFDIRGFFYNADVDGASTIRDIDSRGWPMLAIRSNYAASAGSMSDPGFDGFLRPFPFFTTIFKGNSLGEAFLFSTPFLDSTISHLGDPLMTFTFPFEVEIKESIEENKAWQLMEESTAESVAYIFRKNELLKSTLDLIVNGCDVSSSVALLIPFNRLYLYFGETGWKTDYINLSKELVKFALQRNTFNKLSNTFPNIDDYLTETGNKVHELFNSTLQDKNFVDTIADSNIFEEGSWKIETPVVHKEFTVVFFTFQLEVSDIEDFSNVIISADSGVSTTGWFVEDDNGDFAIVPKTGVVSNFAGRTIKYESQDIEKLTRGDIYFFRIRQFDGTSFSDFINFTKIIFT